MNPMETGQALVYANQIDPLVQVNEATAEVWLDGLERVPAERVRWAIKKYYATQNGNGEQRNPITPAAIRRIITTEVNRRESLGRALEPPKNKAPNPETYRQRNPAEWDRLVRKGAEDRYYELKRRGIPVSVPVHMRGES